MVALSVPQPNLRVALDSDAIRERLTVVASATTLGGPDCVNDGRLLLLLWGR